MTIHLVRAPNNMIIDPPFKVIINPKLSIRYVAGNVTSGYTIICIVAVDDTIRAS